MCLDAGRLLESGEYSDLTIRCGGHEFRVHRVIVCTQSRFFAAACNGEFQEAKSGKISLIEDDPRAVGRMLSYLYTGSYCDHEDNDPGMLVNLRVYTLADKYEIDGLKELAKSKLLDRALSGWYTDEFSEMVMEVFDPTQRGDHALRDVVVHVCSKKRYGLVESGKFRTALMRLPCLGVRLFIESKTKISKLEEENSKLQEENSTLETELREGKDMLIEYRDQLVRAVKKRKAEAAS